MIQEAHWEDLVFVDPQHIPHTHIFPLLHLKTETENRRELNDWEEKTLLNGFLDKLKQNVLKSIT